MLKASFTVAAAIFGDGGLRYESQSLSFDIFITGKTELGFLWTFLIMHDGVRWVLKVFSGSLVLSSLLSAFKEKLYN